MFLALFYLYLSFFEKNSLASQPFSKKIALYKKDFNCDRRKNTNRMQKNAAGLAETAV